jgi:hypothetical protein
VEKGFNILMPIFFFKGENLSNKNEDIFLSKKGISFTKKESFAE